MYNYSAKNNTFYPDSERFVYERYGSWPDDCIPVADSVYDEFAASEPPSGKMRIAGDDGLPKWSDIPAATREELMTIADAQKSQWLAAANARIAPLADAVELHMATDNEVNQLEIWKKYRVLLTRVDTSTAPNIEWPKQPEN